MTNDPEIKILVTHRAVCRQAYVNSERDPSIEIKYMHIYKYGKFIDSDGTPGYIVLDAMAKKCGAWSMNEELFKHYFIDLGPLKNTELFCI